MINKCSDQTLFSTSTHLIMYAKLCNVSICFQVLRWVFLFGIVWVVQFIIACHKMTIAGAVAVWYFTRYNSFYKGYKTSCIYNVQIILDSTDVCVRVVFVLEKTEIERENSFHVFQYRFPGTLLRCFVILIGITCVTYII